MEENLYELDLQDMIEEIDCVMTLLNGVKASLIRQAIGVQGKGLKRKPWTGYEVSSADCCASVKRRLTVCREMILAIRKKVGD